MQEVTASRIKMFPKYSLNFKLYFHEAKLVLFSRNVDYF